MGKTLFFLFESASGYALFQKVKGEEIGLHLDEVQAANTELARFSKNVKLEAFVPFTSAAQALENINAVSEGILTDFLRDFLELRLPKTKPGKKSKFVLGVTDSGIGNAIGETLGITCTAGDKVLELARGLRRHFVHYIKGLGTGDLAQAQLGLGHSYSRAKVKFNVHRVDNMIIQSNALLDQLEKDLNTFAMRYKEWYGWHFPELASMISDMVMFCKLGLFIKDRQTLTEEKLPGLEAITQDSELAKQILAASKMSFGHEMSELDISSIDCFAQRVVSLYEYRNELHAYLQSRMGVVAPNLSALVGERVGARLIQKAGSLTSLAKYPASTVQILGAEKALFRALKTKGNTPKYGLIFHSSFIGKAAPKNKGRMSRSLANKCSLASRIDAFDDRRSSKFGEMFHKQLEERLEFFKTGQNPRRNIDAMKEVLKSMDADEEGEEPEEPAEKEEEVEEKAEEVVEKKKKKKKSKKRKREAEEEEEATPVKKRKKKSKDKKKKKKKKKKAE